MATEYDLLHVGFHFVVDFSALDVRDGNADTKFQSVSGLSVDINTEEYEEGGENHFKHKLPLKTKYPNLVLKRGMLTHSKVIDWCKDAIENFNFQPIDIDVMLLNENGDPVISWNLKNVFPVKWSVDAFNAQESKIVLETLELSYNYFTTQVPEKLETN